LDSVIFCFYICAVCLYLFLLIKKMLCTLLLIPCYERTKYIGFDCHFIWDKILSGDIYIMFVKSGDQLADVFTKFLCHRCFFFFFDK
jgi:hypothetical protein